MRKPLCTALTAAAALLLAWAPARAEEGMWTFDEFPAFRVEQSLGVRVDKAWRDHVRPTIPHHTDPLIKAIDAAMQQPNARYGVQTTVACREAARD